ncbi:MAG: serpin family protein [Vulcanimicrobiota bacterium]
MIKKVKIYAAFILLVLFLTSSFAHATATVTYESLVNGNNKFAVELYRKLSEKDTENLFFSPYSISSALGMTYVGARGKTAGEMNKALNFGHQPQDLPVHFHLLNQTLSKVEKNQLYIANRLWANKNDKFLKNYKNLMKKYFNAPLEKLDFGNAPEKSRKIINNWVEKQTMGKIQNLLPPGIINSATSLILTNAVYFKGQWETEFRKRATIEKDFYLTPDNKIKTLMMQKEEKLNYGKFQGVEVLEIPYKGNELSMFIILPEETCGIQSLDETITHDALKSWLSKLRKTDVRMEMPKFKIETGFELSPVMKAMGMISAFGGADFSGMNGKKDLFISNIIHKAYIDVNEEGTEAAAATAVVVTKTAAVARPVSFRANHPFVFLIKDNKSGSFLFMGRLMNPGK